jgi:hypothetical protein
MRFRSALLGLCLVALPAAAQLDGPAADRATAPAQLQSGSAPGVDPVAAESPWRSGIFVSPRSGQGLSLARGGALDPGLRASAELFQGMPEAPRLLVPGGESAPADGGAYLGYRYSNWTFSSALRQSLDDPRLASTRLDLGASYGYSLTPRHLITVYGGLTLGQAGTGAPAYGALAGDALARGVQRYGEPGAGFRVSWLYALDRNLFVSTTLGYDRLYGDPGEGFRADRNAATFGTVFGYRFY